MHGNGVDVDARDRRSQPVEHLSGEQLGLTRRSYEMRHGLGDERSGAAGGVEHSLIQRIGYDLADHGPREPVRGVVLAERPPLPGRYYRLVKDRGDVGGGITPVEPGDPEGQRAHRGQVANFGRPGEEVRIDDPLKSGVASERSALKQVGGVVGG